MGACMIDEAPSASRAEANDHLAEAAREAARLVADLEGCHSFDELCLWELCTRAALIASLIAKARAGVP